jgi:hypothetical protein
MQATQGSVGSRFVLWGGAWEDFSFQILWGKDLLFSLPKQDLSLEEFFAKCLCMIRMVYIL